MGIIITSFSEQYVKFKNVDEKEFLTMVTQKYILTLYSKGELSLRESAELCNMDIYEFMTLLSLKKMPIVYPEDVEDEDFEDEFSTYFF